MIRSNARDVRQEQEIWDRIWRNKDDDIVIWQMPNIALITWVILTIISIFLRGTAFTIFWDLSLGTLGIWCLLEIIWGANYFRRFLGVVVALLIVAACFKVGY
jgi:hypothetical protein